MVCSVWREARVTVIWMKQYNIYLITFLYVLICYALFFHQWFSDWPVERNTACMCNTFQMKCANVKLLNTNECRWKSTLTSTLLPLYRFCICVSLECEVSSVLVSAASCFCFTNYHTSVLHYWTHNHMSNHWTFTESLELRFYLFAD